MCVYISELHPVYFLSRTPTANMLGALCFPTWTFPTSARPNAAILLIQHSITKKTAPIYSNLSLSKLLKIWEENPSNDNTEDLDIAEV